MINLTPAWAAGTNANPQPQPGKPQNPFGGYTPPPMYPRLPSDNPRQPNTGGIRSTTMPSGGNPPGPFRAVPIQPRMYRAKSAMYPSAFKAVYPGPISATYPIMDVLSPPAIRLPLSLKGGNPGQQYLGLLNEIRDLEVGIENTKALAIAAQQTAETFTDLHNRETDLYHQRAIAEEEWQMSLYDKDLAISRSSYYQNLIDVFRSRHEQKLLLASFIKGAPYDIEKLYYIFVHEWAAQCQVSKYALQGADIQVRIQYYLVDLVKNLQDAGSYYELAMRQKDLVIAQAEFAAKKTLDETCGKGLPTLEEIKKLAESGTSVNNTSPTGSEDLQGFSQR